MSIYWLENANLFLDTITMGSWLKKLEVKHDLAELDVTTFGTAWHQRIGGLQDVSISGDGFLDFASFQAQYGRQEIASVDAVSTVTICPVSSAETSPTVSCQALQCSYTPLSGQVGEVAPFSIEAKGITTAFTGVVLANYFQASPPSTITGNAYQVGAPATGQSIYGAAHITGLAGTSPTLELKLQSAATSGGSWVTRADFGVQSAGFGYWLTPVSGVGITDTWWRIAGFTTGTVSVASYVVSFGFH